MSVEAQLPGEALRAGALVVFMQRRGHRSGKDIGELMLVEGDVEMLRQPERHWKVIQRCGHRHIEMSERYWRCGLMLQRIKSDLYGAGQSAHQVTSKKEKR